ncbi:hypothetical protein NT239_11585 [Chitinibacter sp. SCUT-21]|uniref:ABC transporter substrate-binding protein n=1 Tax=Chitinibacter sp. SCUT-21 TaxID=2970891 RepID=UPI0035A5C3A6
MRRHALLATLLSLPISQVMALPLVTVVESYHPENAWDKAYLQGIKSKLDGVAELQFIALDTKRLPTDEHLQQAALALEQIQRQPPAVAILGDDAALALLGPKLSRMNIPSIFLGINANPERYFDGAKLPSNVSGVLERPQYKSSFALIRELIPTARRILVLLDQDRSAAILHDDIVQLKDAHVDVLMVASIDEWKKSIHQAAGKYDAVLVGTYQALVDEKTQQNIEADVVMKWTNTNSKVPLFGFWDFQVGRDATVGGAVIAGFEQGEVAGKMTKSQLQLPKQSQAIKQGSTARLMLSRTLVERWKLSIPSAMQNRISWLP